MKLRLNDDADDELTAAAQWYEDQCAGLGELFLSDAIDAFIEIERHPRRSPPDPVRAAREIRRAPLKHFPHRIIYEVTDRECVVIAIAHPKRKPGYWRPRLG